MREVSCEALEKISKMKVKSQIKKGRHMSCANLRAIVASREFKFLLVGGINTAVGYLLFVALQVSLPEGISDQSELLMAYVPATILGYLLQRRFVWKSENRKSKEAVRYLLFVAAQFALNLGMLWVLATVLGLNAILAQSLATATLIVIAFIVHGKWTFKPEGEKQ
jgi:putative flippase GtrA